jgi:hypothetical protein
LPSGFERRCFALEWAPQKIYCRARPRHSKKYHAELLRHASLAGVAPGSASATSRGTLASSFLALEGTAVINSRAGVNRNSVVPWVLRAHLNFFKFKSFIHVELLRDCGMRLKSPSARPASLAELQDFLAVRQRWSGTAEYIAGPGRVTPKKIMRSCFVIVNASLAGVAESACNELQEFLSCSSGGAQRSPRASSVKKIVMWSCFVIVNASLEAPDWLCRAAGIFDGFALEGTAEDLLPGQAASPKKISCGAVR